MCVDLGHEIAAAEMRAKISDPAHFAYPPYAKAARDRRARLEQSAQALKAELNRLRYEAAEADQRQLAA